jgi:hypothetical protein
VAVGIGGEGAAEVGAVVDRRATGLEVEIGRARIDVAGVGGVGTGSICGRGLAEIVGELWATRAIIRDRGDDVIANLNTWVVSIYLEPVYRGVVARIVKNKSISSLHDSQANQPIIPHIVICLIVITIPDKSTASICA